MNEQAVSSPTTVRRRSRAIDVDVKVEPGTVTRAMKEMAKDAHKRHRAAAERACRSIQRSFRRDAYFRKYDRGIKSAAFRVLRNPWSPSVLIEVGFIDHDKESAHLAKRGFQQRIARRIAAGVVDHFSSQAAETGARP